MIVSKIFLFLDNFEGLFPQRLGENRFSQIFRHFHYWIRVAAIAGAANNYWNKSARKSSVDGMDQIPTFPGVYFRFNNYCPDIMSGHYFQNTF